MMINLPCRSNTVGNNRGFAIVEVALAIIIMSMVSLTTVYKLREEIRDKQADVLGDHIVAVHHGVDTYAMTEYATLASATPTVTGVANPLAPTFAELQGLGYIDPTLSSTNLKGSPYSILLSQVPVGCTPPNCDVASVVYTTTPLFQKGSATIADSGLLGEAVSRIGANGGSTIANSATFEGAGGGWSRANPLNTVGLLAMRGGYGASGFDVFYRRDGSRAITANFAGGGFDIDNINNANIVNNVNVGNDINVANDVNIVGDASMANLTVTNDGTVVNDFAVGGDQTIGNALVVNTSVTTPTMLASVFTDLDNAGYYVDPSGTSVFNRPQTSRVPTANEDIVNKAYVDASLGGTAILHTFTQGYLGLWRYCSMGYFRTWSGSNNCNVYPSGGVVNGNQRKWYMSYGGATCAANCF